jgi:hypothetical protein
MGNLVWAVAALAVVTFVAPVELVPSTAPPSTPHAASSDDKGGDDIELAGPETTDGNEGESGGKGGTMNCRATSGDAGFGTLALIGLAAWAAMRRPRQRT